MYISFETKEIKGMELDEFILTKALSEWEKTTGVVRKSLSEMKKELPFYSKTKIFRLLNKLANQNYIVKTNNGIKVNREKIQFLNNNDNNAENNAENNEASNSEEDEEGITDTFQSDMPITSVSKPIEMLQTETEDNNAIQNEKLQNEPNLNISETVIHNFHNENETKAENETVIHNVIHNNCGQSSHLENVALDYATATILPLQSGIYWNETNNHGCEKMLRNGIEKSAFKGMLQNEMECEEIECKAGKMSVVKDMRGSAHYETDLQNRFRIETASNAVPPSTEDLLRKSSVEVYNSLSIDCNLSISCFNSSGYEKDSTRTKVESITAIDSLCTPDSTLTKVDINQPAANYNKPFDYSVHRDQCTSLLQNENNPDRNQPLANNSTAVIDNDLIPVSVILPVIVGNLAKDCNVTQLNSKITYPEIDKATRVASIQAIENNSSNRQYTDNMTYSARKQNGRESAEQDGKNAKDKGQRDDKNECRYNSNGSEEDNCSKKYGKGKQADKNGSANQSRTEADAKEKAEKESLKTAEGTENKQPTKQKREFCPDKPNNRQIIAELVRYYRSIDGIKSEAGDYAFIGRMYNEFGYDKVLEAINELGYRVESGFIPHNPKVYMLSMIKRKNNPQNDLQKQTTELDAETEKAVKEVFEYYMETFNGLITKMTLTEKRKAKIAERLKNGYTVDEIKTAIDNIRCSPFHCGENKDGIFYATIEFVCNSDTRLEEWINKITPQKKAESNTYLQLCKLIANQE